MSEKKKETKLLIAAKTFFLRTKGSTFSSDTFRELFPGWKGSSISVFFRYIVIKKWAVPTGAYKRSTVPTNLTRKISIYKWTKLAAKDLGGKK